MDADHAMQSFEEKESDEPQNENSAGPMDKMLKETVAFEQFSAEQPIQIKKIIPIVEHVPIEQPVSKLHPIPIEEYITIEESMPIEEFIPIEESMPTEEFMPIEELIPMETSMPVEESSKLPLLKKEKIIQENMNYRIVKSYINDPEPRGLFFLEIHSNKKYTSLIFILNLRQVWISWTSLAYTLCQF